MKNQKVWRDDKASDLILRDGETHRVPMMMRQKTALESTWRAEPHNWPRKRVSL